MFYLIQHFEADFPQKVSLKMLNSGIILKTFTYDNMDMGPDQTAPIGGSQKLILSSWLKSG